MCVGRMVKTEEDWAEQAKRLVRVEMVRRGVTYEDLAARLTALGVHDTSVNMRNKIARGRFTVIFLLQVMEAVGCGEISLNLKSVQPS
jgi:hypothetical protein